MAKFKRARIQDVAKFAGVSNMTVSRVLNGGVKVSEKKREAVLEAVEKLNYRPDAGARRLASHKSYMIGLLYQDLDISYVTKFLLRALKSCRSHGYHLVPDEVDNDIGNSLTSIKNLIEVTQIDGVILLPPISENLDIITLLQEYEVPFVRIAPANQSDISPYIAIDEYMAGFVMTNHLLELGHEKIAHITGHPEQMASHLRCEGFLDAAKAKGLAVPESYIERGYYTYDSGVRAAKKLLSQAIRPTAIFTANDEMAAAVISVANVMGIKVPEELSVAGIDDAQLAVTMSPHLTTIRQPIVQMADLAVEMLVSGKSSVANSDAKHYRHILDFELVQRQSSSAPLVTN